MSAIPSSPAVARNRDPILAVLSPHLANARLVLEIAAGTGEHAVHLAAACPDLVWQPTDADADALTGIAARRAASALPNVLPPMLLDAAAPDTWPVAHPDAIVAINMVHIAAWAATKGLTAGAGRLLPIGGILFLYGPYREAGIDTSPSNLAFDRSLTSRNSAWGIRHLDEVTALAAAHGLALSERTAMPANNLALVFRKA